jgi:hypothetical protein
VIHPFRHPPKLVVVVAAIVAATALFGIAASPAAAAGAKKTPCWKTLINDWYDGRIDGVYAIHCYREALKHLPADVDTYSSARDDIKQALQRRIQSTKSGGGTTTTGGGQSGGGTGGSGSGGSGSSSGGGQGGGGSASGPIPDIINAGKPAHADSLPIPLLVLGGVALVLMLAGAAGFIVRRKRLRRELAASAASFPAGTTPRPSEQQ